MVIQFQDPRARAYLLAHGHVYTYRVHQRRHVGRDWANTGRGTPKLADVTITLVREIAPLMFGALKPYVTASGFPSVADWVTAIMRQNPRADVATGYLYRVKVIHES